MLEIMQLENTSNLGALTVVIDEPMTTPKANSSPDTIAGGRYWKVRHRDVQGMKYGASVHWHTLSIRSYTGGCARRTCANWHRHSPQIARRLYRASRSQKEDKYKLLTNAVDDRRLLEAIELRYQL